MTHTKKLIFIDYLRSFSMLYIVGYWHLLRYTNAYPDYRIPVAKTMTYVVTLGLFIFISGFLNGKSAVKSTRAVDFYIKRLVRIYPLYLFAVILFLIYGLNDGLTSIKSLVFVSMFHGPAPLTLWFITMIMIFYAIAPFLTRLAQDSLKYMILTAALTTSSIALSWIDPAVDIRLALYLPCFCLGIFCGVKGMENKFYSTPYLICFLIISLIINIIPTDSQNLETLKQIPLMLSSSCLIFAVSCRNQDAFPSISPISFLSYSSYAMYLFHRPIYQTLISFYFPDTMMLQIFYLVGVGLTLVALISWGLQWLNDKLFTAANEFFTRALESYSN